MEQILEGRLWFFRRHLVIFDRLIQSVQHSQVNLVLSPCWLRIGPYPLECDKKDLMHALESTFGGLIRSEIMRECCQIRFMINAEKPLRRRLFVETSDRDKVWLAFKHENLPIFYFDCGIMVHGV